jgi:TPR repeat protein
LDAAGQFVAQAVALSGTATTYSQWQLTPIARMVSRLALFLGAISALLALYAMKVWLLYFLADIAGLQFVKVSPLGDSDIETVSDIVGELPTENVSAEYLAAVESFRKGAYAEALTQAMECAPEDAACLGLHAELHLVGAGIQQNLSEAIDIFHAAAERGDANSQYALGALYSNLFEGDPGEMRRSEGLGVLYLYAASVAGHPGALMAMGYRHSQGYGVPKSCNTAALNYIEVARRVAEVYSAGMPQAVELVRLGIDSKDRKAMSASEVNLFIEIASSGDANIAAAVGKRHLLGIDGFRQNYNRAAHHLQIAADKNHGGAMALLGYMYCLGLGVSRSLDVAYSYFVSSAAQNDALGHNGLGYIHFHGTSVQPQDVKLAFRHFNESAYGGSADGMFNLASLFLTGTGTEQSFQKAALWYTQALDRGHTPAAYTLAVMHLNGVGTMRNCKIAVDLLKRVCERGSWVSQKLQDAYEQQDTHPNTAAWLFLRLAEAGHEVAQMNVAHLFDTASSKLLLLNSSHEDPTEEARALGRVHAQRHYEMSAEQGNAHSELRLGDYAYYGWGFRADEGPEDDFSDEEPDIANPIEAELRFIRQEVDPELSLVHYKRTAAMRITGEWMQPFVARASFNLGYMYQFGVGVPRDVPLARRYYRRCFEVDPSGVQMPVSAMLLLLTAQVYWLEMPPAQ